MHIKKRRWTKTEERFLKINWEDTDTLSLAESLGRSFKAVNNKAYSLNLTACRKGLTLRQASDILGYGHETILDFAQALGISFSKRPKRTRLSSSELGYTYIVTAHQFKRIKDSLMKLGCPKAPVKILNRIKKKPERINGKYVVLKRSKGNTFYLYTKASSKS